MIRSATHQVQPRFRTCLDLLLEKDRRAGRGFARESGSSVTLVLTPSQGRGADPWEDWGIHQKPLARRMSRKRGWSPHQPGLLLVAQELTERDPFPTHGDRFPLGGGPWEQGAPARAACSAHVWPPGGSTTAAKPQLLCSTFRGMEGSWWEKGEPPHQSSGANCTL